MEQYVWTPGARIKLAPEDVGKELKKIHAKSGVITAEAIVSAATRTTSPLHEHFQWDNDIAANKYRLEQARHLIRCIRVTMEQSDDLPAKLVRVYINPLNEGTYHTIVDVMSNDDLRNSALKKVLWEIKAMAAKNQEYEDLFGVLVEAEGKVQELVVTKPP